VHSAPVTTDRRILVVLEPGDEVVTSIAAACSEHGVRQAVVPVFLGAFTSVTLIGSDEPVADPDLPLPHATTVEFVEGVGTATIATGEDGGLAVHLHAAVGVKGAGALARAGHVLAATTHYTAEVLIEEVSGPHLRRRADPRAHGIPTLRLP